MEKEEEGEEEKEDTDRWFSLSMCAGFGASLCHCCVVSLYSVSAVGRLWRQRVVLLRQYVVTLPAIGLACTPQCLELFGYTRDLSPIQTWPRKLKHFRFTKFTKAYEQTCISW